MKINLLLNAILWLAWGLSPQDTLPVFVPLAHTIMVALIAYTGVEQSKSDFD